MNNYTTYTFEGRTIESPLQQKTLDKLASISIEYKMHSNNNAKKLADSTRSYFNGYIDLLILLEVITKDHAEELIGFFF